MMVIGAFNMYSGVSVFHESNVVTKSHSHPAMEIIIANDGTFNISSDNTALRGIRAAVIFPNYGHKLDARGCSITIFMIESTFVDIEFIIQHLQSDTKQLQEISLEIATLLTRVLNQPIPKPLYDQRIIKVIEFISNAKFEDSLSRLLLAQLVFLSESRLSHLFKSETGFSLSSYIKWHKMKLALNQMVSNGFHLSNAALNSGFYDIADFSKQFKNMFGLAPSIVYNDSTIVQDQDKV